MPKIDIRRSHALDPATARQKVEEVTAGLKDRFNAKVAWQNDRELEIKGTGFEGSVTLDPTEVRLVLELSLMMTPFKGMAEEHIKKAIDRAFG